MRRLFPIAAIVVCLVVPSVSAPKPKSQSGHYLFVWAGDRALRAKDFLAVIDADPSSPNYGQLLTTLATDQTTLRVHHTEYTMPESAMLFANDHDAGRTFIFDLHDPLHPSVATSFTDMAGYMHPHSYLRLPNGHVLVSFQDSHASMDSGSVGRTGGLVEIDDTGKLIRSASNADPKFRDAWLTPYSLVPLPDIDRIVSTNSSMQEEGTFRGVTYQVWRLSDLKLLSTNYLDVGDNRYAQVSPEEPRLGPDGSVYVQTLACGLERITGLTADHPTSQLVYTFPGDWCGVPTIVGHFLVETAFNAHVAIVLDISNGAKPVEVSRVNFANNYFPHWSAWDPVTKRIVVTPGREGTSRLYLLNFDTQTGALKIDDTFHDADNKPGFNFEDREWPHGWKGWAWPHGAVFSRAIQ
jgi:56kDa selenium binding protein (SBP56)